MKKLLIVSICLALIAVFAAANFFTPSTTGAVITETVEENISVAVGKVSLRILDADTIEEFYLQIENDELNDKTLRVKEGDYLILEIEGSNRFTIPSLNVDVELSNEPVTVQFDAPREGAYEFYLDDMKGILKVRKKIFGLF